MKNKNKAILIFSIFFLVGLGCCFLNISLTVADWFPSRNPYTNLSLPSDLFQLNIPAVVSKGSSTNPLPTLTFSVSNPQISSEGLSAMLNWESKNATSCTASADPINSQWSGQRALSGSQEISDITSNILISLNCSGAGGSISRFISYKPVSIAAESPTVIFSVDPPRVSIGGSATLTWSSQGATSCEASVLPANSQWTGTKDLSGSQTITNITENTDFYLACSSNGGGIRSKMTSIILESILSPTPNVQTTPTSPSFSIPIYAPTLTLYASPVNISANGSTLLSWASENATSCTASANPANNQWTGTKDLSGSQTITNITENTNFSLICSGPKGNANDAALVSLSNFSSKQNTQEQINQISNQIAQLQSQLSTTNNQQQLAGTNSDGSWCYTFTKTLKYKDTGYAVGALQAALQKEGLLNIPKLTAYFGLVTKNAVIAFQEKYKEEILSIYSLDKGTGFVGNATIKKLNQLYGCMTTNTASSSVNGEENQTIANAALQCQNLWWYDNNSTACNQKQFCGTYMYLGLKTFQTEADCKALLNNPQTCDKKCKAQGYSSGSCASFETTSDGLTAKDAYEKTHILMGETSDCYTPENSTLNNCYCNSSNATTTVVVPTNLPPVLDDGTGPTLLKINQTGTWIIKAHDPENGTLSYKVSWGDGTYDQKLVSAESQSADQSFTHSYINAGAYTAELIITDDHQSVKNMSMIVTVDLTCDQQCKAKGWTAFNCAAAKIQAEERTCCCYEQGRAVAGSYGGPMSVYMCSLGASSSPNFGTSGGGGKGCIYIGGINDPSPDSH